MTVMLGAALVAGDAHVGAMAQTACTAQVPPAARQSVGSLSSYLPQIQAQLGGQVRNPMVCREGSGWIFVFQVNAQWWKLNPSTGNIQRSNPPR